MSITPKQFRSLPECFQDKIKIDEQFSDFRQDNVLDFVAGRRLSNLTLTYRLRCKAFIKAKLTGGASNSA